MACCPVCSRPRSSARWGHAVFFARLLILKCPCGYAWEFRVETPDEAGVRRGWPPGADETGQNGGDTDGY